jgi:hypothetical protein
MLAYYSLSAQKSLPDTLYALRISQAINLDGMLNEEVWQKAIHIKNFTQRELAENEPGTEPTEIAVVYDNDNLYLGIWCYDSEPDKLMANQLRRDFEWWTQDNMNIIIDTYNDKRNGYLFVINPLGARADALVLNNGDGFNTDWHGVWDCAAKITEKGWFAEVKIPFNTLKFTSAQIQNWGINFERNIRRKREQVQWQGWSRDASIDNVNRAGTLAGLQGLSSTNLIEIKPYALGGIQFNPSRNNDITGNIGGDINYLITPELKLNLTANTDFAQVEVDRVQVNLTRFNLFFPEKREFFLEGRDYFDFGLDGVSGFYSRRIGLPTNTSSETVPIYGGLRLLGKTGDATIGILSMQTGQKDEIPSTNFTAVSYRHDILESSFISANAVSKVEAGNTNLVYGTQFNYNTRHFLGDKNFTLGAAIAQSYTSNADQKTALSHNVYFFYPNNIVRLDGSWQRVEKNFNPETGFLFAGDDYQSFNLNHEIRPRPDFLPWIQYLSFIPFRGSYVINDRTGAFDRMNYSLRPIGFLTKSGEWFSVDYTIRADNPLSPFNIVGYTVQPREYWWHAININAETFNGRELSGEINYSYGGYYDGKRIDYTAAAVWRTNRFVSISADYSRNELIFGEQKRIINNFGSRINIATSTRLFGSLFTQWNDATEQIFLNFRMNWIPVLGADVFFVVNQAVNTQGKLTWGTTTIQSKFIWRFVI